MSHFRLWSLDHHCVAAGWKTSDGLWRLTYRMANLGGYRGGEPYKRPRRFTDKCLQKAKLEAMAYDLCYREEA